MKVTIDVPDDLYRRVKAKTAAQGRRVREVSIELFERWVHEDAPDAHADAESWLTSWFAKADKAAAKAPRGKTARDALSEGRSRLDNR